MHNYFKVFGQDVMYDSIIDVYHSSICKVAQAIPELRPLLFMFRISQNIYLITAAEQKPLISAVNILDN
jgi:hypothetical protein